MFASTFTAQRRVWIVTDEFMYIQTDEVPLHIWTRTARIPLDRTDEVGVTDHNIITDDIVILANNSVTIILSVTISPSSKVEMNPNYMCSLKYKAEQRKKEHCSKI